MAPHAGTTGLKVLLAGTSQLDLGEAQAFLSGEGAVGTFCGAFNLAILRLKLQADEAFTLHPYSYHLLLSQRDCQTAAKR